MNAKKAKQLRRRARRLTQHLNEAEYIEGKTVRLGECTKGAYKALKTERFRTIVE